MKKTIHGLRYDTEKAILIGEYYNGNDVNDFSYWEASLFKTQRSGRYFLAGSGGPMTRYATAQGNQSGWGERIDPMTPEKALEWAEKYLDQDAIDEHFSNMIEDA